MPTTRADLERMYDGPIPREELARCREMERAMTKRPTDIYTLIYRSRQSGTVFSDAYADLDQACENFADTDWLEYECLGAAHTKLDHPVAAGASENFDIAAAVEAWTADRRSEAEHIGQERRAYLARVA